MEVDCLIENVRLSHQEYIQISMFGLVNYWTAKAIVEPLISKINLPMMGFPTTGFFYIVVCYIDFVSNVVST